MLVRSDQGLGASDRDCWSHVEVGVVWDVDCGRPGFV